MSIIRNSFGRENIKTWKQCLSFIKADLYRNEGKISIRLFLEHYFLNEGFQYCVWLRISTYAMGKSRLLFIICRFILLNRQRRFTIIISPKARIGRGLYIGHFGTIVINSTSTIGKNLNISQGVTIGSNDGPAAINGDNVYIGPGAKIIGSIRIGDNVTIGANAVVTKDVPDNATIAGVPAKILSFDYPARYIGNKT